MTAVEKKRLILQWFAELLFLASRGEESDEARLQYLRWGFFFEGCTDQEILKRYRIEERECEGENDF